MIFNLLLSLMGVFLIFLAPTLMLLLWNSEKISVINPKKDKKSRLT